MTGVLSRYFVVGFWVPWFFALAVLWQAASRGLLPNEFEAYGVGSQLLIVGAIALLAALAASGLNYHIIRLLEGYPLLRGKQRPLTKDLYSALVGRQRTRYDALIKRRDDPAVHSDDQTDAAWRLDRFFPDGADRILPTRLGNAIRAFEDYPYKRWGLDGVALWPRVEMMLTADEREPYTDAKIDVNVFLNAVVGAIVAGVVLVADGIAHDPLAWNWWWAYFLPFIFAYVAYRFAVGAAARWGSEVRTVYDLKRLALYQAYGLKAPASAREEKKLATALNRLVLYGDAIDEQFWIADASPRAARAVGTGPERRSGGIDPGVPAANESATPGPASESHDDQGGR